MNRIVAFGCGGVLGLALMGWLRPLAWAQARLFFPSALQLEAGTPLKSGSQPEERNQAELIDPVVWAEEVLTSKEAVEVLCKRIERSEERAKARALRSAVLLGEPGRLIVEKLPENGLRITVAAEDRASALMLCEGLLAFLTFKTKIPLQDPDADAIVEVERKLRVQERDLGRAYYSRLGFDSPANAREAVNSLGQDVQEYQASVNEYRPLLRRQFLRESQTAAAGVYFVILEPPAPQIFWQPWLASSCAGGVGGLLVAGLGRFRRGKSKEAFDV